MSQERAKGAARGRPNLKVRQFPIPTVGEMLRYLVVEGRLELSSDAKKSLDRLCNGSAANFVNAEKSVVREILSNIEQFAGADWANHWEKNILEESLNVRNFAASVPVFSISTSRGREIYRDCIAPVIVSDLVNASEIRSGPDLKRFISYPFSGWLGWLQGQISTSSDIGLNRTPISTLILEVSDFDHATWERWLSGERIKKLRPSQVADALLKVLPEEKAKHATGWFFIAQLVQNAAIGWRRALDAISVDDIPAQPVIAEQLADEMSHQMPTLQLQRIGRCCGIVAESLNSARPLPESLSFALYDLKRLIKGLSSPANHRLLYLYHWSNGLYQARLGNKKAATDSLERAVKVAWWCAGIQQRNILKDALLYASFNEDKVGVKKYWDRSFYLRYDDYDKPMIEDHNLHRIAIAAQNRFGDLSEDKRIGIHLVNQDECEKVILAALKSSKALNRISKIGGRNGVRYTPLMLAAALGKADQVDALISAGADVSICIPESGRTALSEAFECAIHRNDLAPLNMIIDSLPPLQKSKAEAQVWNRPIGTEPEWPLALAIELGDAKVVKRLLDLGVSVRRPCRFDWPPLFYVCQQFAWGLSDVIRTQSEMYLHGAGYASVHDARQGAIFQSELSSVRQNGLNKFMRSSRHREIAQHTLEHFQKTHDASQKNALCEIASLLIDQIGNVSPRLINEYVLPGPENEHQWTAVHFAAQIGDVALMKILLEFGGDPSLPIRSVKFPQSDECRDAHWIAKSYKNEKITELFGLHSK